MATNSIVSAVASTGMKLCWDTSTAAKQMLQTRLYDCLRLVAHMNVDV